MFNEGVITPNDAFFVRYHWSGIPDRDRPANLSPARRRQCQYAAGAVAGRPQANGRRHVELVAVNQCSGNSRGHLSPRVNGGQLSQRRHGQRALDRRPAEARCWKRPASRPASVQVSFNGLDTPPVGDGPDFIKALDIDHALDGEVMLAWQMNGADLPMLNGYPLRLVVPGYYGTYWVKHLSDITVTRQGVRWLLDERRLSHPGQPVRLYRTRHGADQDRADQPLQRALLHHQSDRRRAASQAGRQTVVRGIAFDGGYGVNEVAFSADGGKNWQAAQLGKDLGRYSFREWSVGLHAAAQGRATTAGARRQPDRPEPAAGALWNPPGYMRNVVESTRIVAV